MQIEKHETESIGHACQKCVWVCVCARVLNISNEMSILLRYEWT